MKHLKFYLSSLCLVGIMACDRPQVLEEPEICLVDDSKKRNQLYGDIIYTPQQLKMIEKYGGLFSEKPSYIGPEIDLVPVTNFPKNPEAHKARAIGTLFEYRLWSMVRFVYGDNLSESDKQEIKKALLHWQENTNVRFYNATGKPTRDPRWNFEYPYIEFRRNSKTNNSYIGRIGGRQEINLSSFTQRTIIHEIGHAIGMFHEHSRPDRNKSLNIDFSNLHTEHHKHFAIIDNNYHLVGESVDFNSVMIYDSYAGALDFNKPVMTKKDGSVFFGGNSLSENDRRWANRFYYPYVARSDGYAELDKKVYKPDNTIMTDAERQELEKVLNRNYPFPKEYGERIPNDF